MWRSADSRLLAGVFAAGLLLLALSAVAFSLNWNLIHSDRRAAAALERADRSDSALLLLVDAETGYRGYVMSGEDRFLEPYRRAMSRLASALDALEALAGSDSEQARRVRQFRALARKAVSHFELAIESRRARPGDTSVHVLQMGQGKLIMDEIRSVASQLSSEEHRLFGQSASGWRRQASQTQAVIAAGAGLAAIVLGIVFYQFRRQGRVRAEQVAYLASQVSERTAQLTHTNAALLRTNRAVTALSRCNRALSHATDEGTLLESICQIVVETGAYRLCRVAEAVDGDLPVVRTLAAAGEEPGLLDQVASLWIKPLGGQSAVSQALRTGATSIVRHAEPGAGEEWPRRALELGLRSVIGLPLKEGDRVWGVLVIASGDSTAFDQQEVSLLTEMAADLEFGVSRLRTRAEQRQTLEQLRRSEDMYRAILQTSLGSILVTNLEGRILEVNQSVCSLLGYAPGDLLAMRADDLVAGRSAEYVQERREQLMREGRGFWEGRLTARDGALLDVEINGSFLPAYGRIVLFLRDVTARKKALLELRESEETFRAFMQNLPCGASIKDEQGRFVYLKSLDPALAGAKVDWSGKTPEEVFHFPLPEESRRDEALARDQGQAVIREMDVFLNEVPRRLLTICFPIARDDGSVRVGTVTIDLTHQKRLEAALDRSESQLRLALSAAGLGTWFRNPATGESQWSERSREIFGLGPESEITPETTLTAVHPEDRAGLIAHVQRAVAEHSTFEYEHRVLWPDGSLRWVSSHGRAEYDAAGEAVTMAGVHQDITARKEAEQALRELAETLERKVQERTAQLEDAYRELEAFSYSISHDLRAPLRAVDGYVQILLEDYAGSLDAEGIEVCHVISGGARRMAQLIDDLLTFSRLGRTALQPAPVDMTTLADSIFHELTTEEQRERIEFHVNELPRAAADAALMRQVWANLLSNAIKFSSGAVAPAIAVTADQQPGEFVYSIQDNGVGFDMRYVGKLFSVFQRLHSDEEFPGTGVGLAIVQRIIHRHGGRVWAESHPNQKTIFSFSLPQREPSDE